jgi:hypothetical protein
MATQEAAPVPPNTPSPVPDAAADASLDVGDVARMLKASERTVRRFDSMRAVPGRFCVGRLVRFRRELVLEWISDGCPLPRTGKGAHRG